jgi:hypothetical protein
VVGRAHLGYLAEGRRSFRMMSVAREYAKGFGMKNFTPRHRRRLCVVQMPRVGDGNASRVLAIDLFRGI